MEQKIKVRYLSKKEMAKEYGRPIRGRAAPSKGLITIREDRKGKGTLEHEQYHIMAGHSEHVRKPETYVRNEIDAYKYEYEKTGHPKHMWGNQVHILNRLQENFELYDKKTKKNRELPRGTAIQIMESQIMPRDDIPKEWKEDFKILKHQGIEHRHPSTTPQDPQIYAKQDIDKYKDRFEKTGTPKHFDLEARDIALALKRHYPSLPAWERLGIVGHEITSRTDIPKHWNEDFKRVKQMYVKLRKQGELDAQGNRIQKAQTGIAVVR